MLGSYKIVNVMVVDGRCNGICSVRKCIKRAKFWLFIDDGLPKLSRAYSITCEKHLNLSVRKANAYNLARRKSK